MNWKEQLRILEKNKQWDDAIKLMNNTIAKDPDNLDAYLSINYLLMNLIVEEHDYDRNKRIYYADLLQQYFDESYAKFSQNPEYLFFIGIIARISEWYVDLDIKDVEKIFQKAIALDPNNFLYHCTLNENDPKNKLKIIACAKWIIKNASPIKNSLDEKGALGEYTWGFMKFWAESILAENNLVV